jgi:hypothetical protein
MIGDLVENIGGKYVEVMFNGTGVDSIYKITQGDEDTGLADMIFIICAFEGK